MAIRAAAILLLLSVLLLFLVPASSGPFSAVHGPVTALRAHRAAQVFFFNLAEPARHLVRSSKAPLDLAHSHGNLGPSRIAPPLFALLSELRC